MHLTLPSNQAHLNRKATSSISCLVLMFFFSHFDRLSFIFFSATHKTVNSSKCIVSLYLYKKIKLIFPYIIFFSLI